MESFKETRRQIQAALLGVIIVLAIGTTGYVLIEGKDPLQALYLTVITLTTVGYGDDYAVSDAGRLFTMFMILFGFGVVAYGLQATATFLVSPQIRELRNRHRTEKICSQLERHYIICGTGDLVDQTITYLLQSVHMRRAHYDEEIYTPIDNFLDDIFGDDELGHYPRIRAVVREIYLTFSRLFKRVGTLLDVVVVVTNDENYAQQLRSKGLLVIEGQPTSDETLISAGVERANAMMVMLTDDTAALLTVLTARSHNNTLYITAATMGEALADKTLRVGANNVVRPYELAGQFLNNVTLRPTVHDFFHGILFDQTLNIQSTQVVLEEGADWVGKKIGDIKLRERLNANILGIHHPDQEDYIIAPHRNYKLSQGETLIICAPASSVARVQEEGREGTKGKTPIVWQKNAHIKPPPESSKKYTLAEAATAIEKMSKHFVVCGDDQVARNATQHLDPERPFVIITEQQAYAEQLMERGFRVVLGDPTHEQTLLRAGVARALATMISLENEADTVLAVINARSISKHLLITATANHDDHIRKIRRAGADRVFNPFSVAAQFVLLATTRPNVSQFFQHVLYNRVAEIETTELYMENSSPWIGKTISELRLERLFRAHVIGVRHTNGKFSYAPPAEYAIREHEVLLVVIPMANSDALRTSAHGDASKRPDTLRRTHTIPTTIGQNPSHR